MVVGLLTQEEFDKIAALGVHPHAGELMIIRWLHDLCCAANLTGIGAPGILSLSEAVKLLCCHIEGLLCCVEAVEARSYFALVLSLVCVTCSSPKSR